MPQTKAVFSEPSKLKSGQMPASQTAVMALPGAYDLSFPHTISFTG